MTEDEDLLDLPEDPEMQLVAYERRLRTQMWDNIGGSQGAWSYNQDQKIFYMTKIIAFHDAHGFSMLTKPQLPRRAEDFDKLFDEFLDEITYWTTQIEVRHTQRLRPIYTILVLTEDIKRQIHSYINKIREAIQPIELRPSKKEALYAKLNALADEVDRDRTKAEAWTALTLEVASTGGKAAEELKPVRRLVDSIGNLLGKAKEIADRTGLPAPGERKRIEPPPKQLPPHQATDLEDEIPF